MGVDLLECRCKITKTVKFSSMDMGQLYEILYQSKFFTIWYQFIKCKCPCV